MNRNVTRTILISVLLLPAAALAQDAPPPSPAANPLTAHSRSVYSGAQRIVLRAAETMPEENYTFQPTDAVRSFGQILGHIADAQYAFCSQVRREKNPAPGIEKTKTSKAELIAALREAFAYCNQAYDGLTDASAAETVKMMGRDTPRLGVMNVNQVHTIEHYGNLVTYLRMKTLVPPTSDPEFMKKLME